MDIFNKLPNGMFVAEGPFSPDEVLAQADLIYRERRAARSIQSPAQARAYLEAELRDLKHEAFAIACLDTRHVVLDVSVLFRGTVDGASVHPREVVKHALAQNAVAVVFAHNHPSGDPSPSEADKRITARLSDALKLVEISLLDHFVIGKYSSLSFAEQGLL